MDKKNRIIHIICGKTNSKKRNQITEIVHRLAAGQTELGYQAEIWCITDIFTKQTKDSDAFRCLEFKLKKRGLDDKLKEAILSEMEPVVFHLHGGFIFTYYLLSEVFELLDIPFIFTPYESYDPDGKDLKGWSKKFYFRLFEKKVIIRAGSVKLLDVCEIK